MKDLLSRPHSSALHLGLSGLMLSALVFLAACGGGASGPPGAPAGMGPPGAPAGGPPGAPVGSAKSPISAVKPPAGAPGPAAVTPPGAGPVKPPGPAVNPPGVGEKPADPKADADGETPLAIGKVQQAGNDVELASSIISAKTNPFLSRLPKPKVEVATAGGEEGSGAEAAAPPPADDPFAAVNLLGVVYSKKSPIALVSLSGGEAQSELVKKGTVLQADGGPIKVVGIGQDSIELELIGGSKEKRTLFLPDIVGYNASDGSSGGSSSSSSGRPSMRSGAPGASGLSNLQRLSEKSGNPANISLQE